MALSLSRPPGSGQHSPRNRQHRLHRRLLAARRCRRAVADVARSTCRATGLFDGPRRGGSAMDSPRYPRTCHQGSLGMTSPTITAAICTRNRPLQLARALDSLLAQSLAPAEIMVVDNSPSDEATARLVSERFSEVRYLREPVPGLDFARNRALREASGEIVAFLDDDAVA